MNELTRDDPQTGKSFYFDQAALQLGVNQTNDFIFGDLHRVLRERLAYAIDGDAIPGAVPLDDLELHPEVPAGTPPEDPRQLRLEAPLAIQSSSPRAGAFAYNKFSAVPLLTKATRAAQVESEKLLSDVEPANKAAGDDAKKRLMAIPNFRVTRLVTTPTQNGRVRVTRVLGLRREPRNPDIVFLFSRFCRTFSGVNAF